MIHTPVHDELYYISPVFKRRRGTQLCIYLVFIVDVYRLWDAVGIEYHEVFRHLAGIGGNEGSHRRLISWWCDFQIYILS